MGVSAVSCFAGQLRELREKAGLSQYALAKRTGLSKQTMSALEMGMNDPTWETVQKLAQALGVDCSVFLDPSLAIPGDVPAAPRGRPPKKPDAQGAGRLRKRKAKGK